MVERGLALKRLNERLMQAVREADTQTLRSVADTLDQLSQLPHGKDAIVPDDAVGYALLLYFQRHEAGTIDELLEWCATRIANWNVYEVSERRTRDKMIRRTCERLELSIAPSKPGPK